MKATVDQLSSSPIMRIVFSIAIVTAILRIGVPDAGAQIQWEQQATFPTPWNLDNAVFLTADHGFVVGRLQTLCETTDGGETWRVIKSGSTNSDPFYTVAFPDAMHGYVTGNNNDAWRTVDGGKTWLAMPDVPAGSWSNLDFLTPTVGFSGANGALIFTQNGGVSWQIQSGYPECPVIFGMDFRDEDVGLVAGNQIRGGGIGIYRSVNGGQDWTKVFDMTTNDVQFLTPTVVIATVVDDLRIYESRDAGLSWAPLTPAFDEDGPINDLERLTANRVVATSTDGDVWLSTDGGVSWVKKVEPIGDLPYDWRVQFSDSLNGAVTGPHGILFKTSDGGDTWRLVTSGVGMHIEDVEMYDDLYGYGIGTNGYVIRTLDSGHHWDLQKVEVSGQVFNRDEDLRCIDIVDAQMAVVAGAGGTVFRTMDGGDTWESIGYPELSDTIAIEDTYFLDANEGWVVGDDRGFQGDRSVYHTTDGGLTWTSPSQLRGVWQRLEFTDPLHGILMGLSGAYKRTEDGGNTWVDGDLPNWRLGRPNVTDMAFSDPNNGWAVGWWGYYAKTIDGGRTWMQSDFGSNVRVALGVEARDENEAWILATDDRSTPIILHTVNGGSTWAREQSPGALATTPSEITRTTTGRLWIGGASGSIWASDPLPIGSIRLSSTEIHRGQQATFTVTNADVGESVVFLYSLKGLGNGPCVPQLGGLCLDLLSPIKQFGSRNANANGTAILNVIVPKNAPLQMAHFQSVAKRGSGGVDSVRSNTVSEVIQN